MRTVQARAWAVRIRMKNFAAVRTATLEWDSIIEAVGIVVECSLMAVCVWLVGVVFGFLFSVPL